MMSEPSEKQNIDLLAMSMMIEQHAKTIEQLKNMSGIGEKRSASINKKNDEETENQKNQSKSKNQKNSFSLTDEEDEGDDDINLGLINDKNEKEESIETEESSFELQEILKDIAGDDGYGPPLLTQIADGFAKTVSRPLKKDNTTQLRDKIKVPENLKQFLTPKVNGEIWRILPTLAKLNDVRYQQMQQGMSSALASLASIANSLMENDKVIPKEVRNKIMQSAIDGANVLGDQFQSVSCRRRYDMRRYLNPEYAGICSSEVPPGEWIFGENLSERLKQSKAGSAVVRGSSLKANRFVPYKQYRNQDRPLNSYRPFSNSYPRGNGSFRGRQWGSRGSSMLPRSNYRSRFNNYGNLSNNLQGQDKFRNYQ